MIEVVIVGGGSVGLFCAAALAHRGIAATVLERELAPPRQTRSIGIHPPSLERLAALGLAGAFVERGVRIRRGIAFGGGGRLGEVDFAAASDAFPFALSLPQPDTERLLEAAVRAGPARLLRGARVTGVAPGGDALVVGYDDGQPRELRARWVIGCDGRDSAVRDALGIAFEGKRYPGSYLMADVRDDGKLGAVAAVFLADDGVVESFPLPGGKRRWVLQAPEHRDRADARELCELVAARTGRRIDPAGAENASAFGVEQRLASRFRHGRALLLGDAAHVLSPFGGQGMNLGWLDAWALAEALATEDPRSALVAWERDRRRAARSALRRAAFNTRLGRRTRFPGLRNALVRAALAPPLRRPITRLFAMQGLT